MKLHAHQATVLTANQIGAHSQSGNWVIPASDMMHGNMHACMHPLLLAISLVRWLKCVELALFICCILGPLVCLLCRDSS